MARNRYGWEKRAKEMARKQKHDEKIKRRQGKIESPPAAEAPEALNDHNGGEPEPAGENLPQDS